MYVHAHLLFYSGPKSPDLSRLARQNLTVTGKSSHCMVTLAMTSRFAWRRPGGMESLTLAWLEIMSIICQVLKHFQVSSTFHDVGWSSMSYTSPQLATQQQKGFKGSVSVPFRFRSGLRAPDPDIETQKALQLGSLGTFVNTDWACCSTQRGNPTTNVSGSFRVQRFQNLVSSSGFR